jgi:hypothetical protein
MKPNLVKKIIAIVNLILILCMLSVSYSGYAINWQNNIESLYFGGDLEDDIMDIKIDSIGNLILAGFSISNNYPQVGNGYHQEFAGGGLDSDHGVSGDIILTKLDPSLNLIWSTYLGGSGKDGAITVLIDEFDDIIIIGLTDSINFPVTQNANQKTFSGGLYDNIIVKFSTDGDLLYSSYFGTPGNDKFSYAKFDSNENIIICGTTDSTTYPVTNDAFQSTNAGFEDGFIAKFDSNFSILYSTYFGGTNYDGFYKFDLDNENNLYITGYSMSDDFPLTDSNQKNKLGSSLRDIVIVKFNSSFGLQYSTYYGGTNIDDSFDIKVDNNNHVILTGRTWSTNFPTINANKSTLSGAGPDAFVSKLDLENNSLLFSSYFGGTGWDSLLHISTTINNEIILSGIGGYGIPLINPIQETPKYNDMILIELSPQGEPIFGSFFGGSGEDFPTNQLIYNNNLMIVGYTSSTDFPFSNSGSSKGSRDGFFLTFYNKNSSLKSSDSLNTNSYSHSESSSKSLTLPLFSISLCIFLIANRRRRKLN